MSSFSIGLQVHQSGQVRLIALDEKNTYIGGWTIYANIVALAEILERYEQDAQLVRAIVAGCKLRPHQDGSQRLVIGSRPRAFTVTFSPRSVHKLIIPLDELIKREAEESITA